MKLTNNFLPHTKNCWTAKDPVTIFGVQNLFGLSVSAIFFAAGGQLCLLWSAVRSPQNLPKTPLSIQEANSVASPPTKRCMRSNDKFQSPLRGHLESGRLVGGGWGEVAHHPWVPKSCYYRSFTVETSPYVFPIGISTTKLMDVRYERNPL